MNFLLHSPMKWSEVMAARPSSSVCLLVSNTSYYFFSARCKFSDAIEAIASPNLVQMMT